MKSYAGVGHTITPQILQDASMFIGNCLPAGKEFVLPPKDPSTMSIKELKEFIKNEGLLGKTVGFSEKQEFVNLVIEYYQKHGLV